MIRANLTSKIILKFYYPDQTGKTNARTHLSLVLVLIKNNTQTVPTAHIWHVIHDNEQFKKNTQLMHEIY
jgi:hypothetical protein